MGAAVVWHSIKNFPRAIEDYSKAIELAAADTQSFDGRAKAFYEMGEFEKALADWEAALRLNPNDTQALLGRGTVRFEKYKDYANALADYSRVIELPPRNNTAMFRGPNCLRRAKTRSFGDRRTRFGTPHGPASCRNGNGQTRSASWQSRIQRPVISTRPSNGRPRPWR